MPKIVEIQFTEQVKDTIAESRLIAIALGDNTIYCEHFILGMFKVAPDNTAVQYMETVMPKQAWTQYLQEIAKNKALLSQQPTKKPWWDFIFSSKSPSSISRSYEKALKLSYLEAKALEIKEINIACILLSILRDANFEGKLSYDMAKNFIKNNL